MKKTQIKVHEPKLDKMTRGTILRRIRRRYLRSTRKKAKTWLMNMYCGATGITRKYAIVHTHGGRGRAARGGQRGRPVLYDDRLKEPLRVIWQAAAYSCAELLHTGMARLLAQLLAHQRLAISADLQRLLLQMSCAILKRSLRRALPYAPRVLDVDNDRAFTNETVMAWLAKHGIALTRSRAQQSAEMIVMARHGGDGGDCGGAANQRGRTPAADARRAELTQTGTRQERER
ncbi:MAG: transposase family protein [bacterium]|nr:transposase family protein [bacterium]